MLLLSFFGVALIRADDDTCSNGKKLQTKTDYTYCAGLTPLPKGTINSQEECEQACCDDPNCEAWQYCPTDEVGACFDMDGKNWNSQPCFNGPIPTKCSANKLTRFIGRTSATPGTLIPVRTKPVTRKRGMSGMLNNKKGTTIFTCNDPALLGLKDSWWYNWGVKSTQTDYCLDNEGLWSAQIAGEFVPMIESTKLNVEATMTPQRIADWERGNAQFLLGFNEPDRNNEPYAKGAEYWPNVQKVAAMFDPPLKLITAAPSSTDFDENGASKWLDGFFDYCENNVPDCDPELIDGIGFHDYVGNITLIEQKINGMAKRYRKKDGTTRLIWLTEVGVGRWLPPSGPPLSEKLEYMPKLLKMLDENQYVYRYAWFTSRFDPVVANQESWSGPTSLFDNKGTDLTELGKIYQVKNNEQLVAPTHITS